MPLRPVLSLGAGAMAEVFLARAAGGRLVAVKIAHAATARDPSLRALFEAEAEAARVVIHPRLVPCLGTTETPLAMVLGYVDGPSLEALTLGRPPLPLPLAARIAHDVAEGLAALAAEGRTHGDLCPRNVLVDRQGAAWSSDFGASDAAPPERPFLGTFGYAAPEVCRGRRGDARSDLFSLGVLLWELARGERLHGADTLPEAARLVRFAETEAPPLDAGRADLAALAPLAARLLTLDPTARCRSAREAASELTSVATLAPRSALGAHVAGVFAAEAQRREIALNAVAARYGDG